MVKHDPNLKRIAIGHDDVKGEVLAFALDGHIFVHI
jgi:hypothetical protein